MNVLGTLVMDVVETCHVPIETKEATGVYSLGAIVDNAIATAYERGERLNRLELLIDGEQQWQAIIAPLLPKKAK